MSWRLAGTKKATRERGEEGKGKEKEEGRKNSAEDFGRWWIRPVKLLPISIACVQREVRLVLFYSREESRALVNRAFWLRA